MNARNLSRQLATSVVDALKAHGHILVVKGGAAALGRELAELMAPAVEVVAPRVEPRGPLADEPTSTFGDEHTDQVVEDMVARLTRALMSSDHVEDVFAEDAVIRRDIFRTVQAGLLAPAIRGDDERGEERDERSTLTVKLDTLGYVAATVSKRADADTLRQAFDRAAAVAHARFAAYSPAQREATFQSDRGGPDERLEIEEAVADELTDLAEQGVVQLPTVERRIELPRAASAAEQRALAPRIDALAESTLLQSGCAAAWDFVDGRTIRVTFTPLSDQDARGVDAPTSAFAREIAALLPPGEPKAAGKARAAAEPAAAPVPPARATEPAAVAAPAAEAAPPSRRKKEPSSGRDAGKSPAPSAAAAPAAAEPVASAPEPAARPRKTKRAGAAEPAAPAPKRKRAAAAKTSPTPRSSAKRTTVKTTKAPAKKG